MSLSMFGIFPEDPVSVLSELRFLPVDEAVKSAKRDLEELIPFDEDERSDPRPLLEWLKDVDHMKKHGTPEEQKAAREVDTYEWLLAWRRAGRPRYV